jgi:acetolactate synthase I/II/III large subunit
MRAVEAIANVIVEEGVTEAFGLMGDGNMLLITSLSDDLGIPFHSSRHEGAAVGMADGYARVTGDVAFCTVTQGPGLTNTVTALVTARKARTPLVLFVGDVPAAQAGWPQDIDHRRLLDGIDVPMIDLTDTDRVHVDVAAAFERARTERRPIAINMRVDLQKHEWNPWDDDDEPTSGSAPSAPTDEDVAAVVDLLASASRPVILAGRGARHARGRLIELGEATGALLATTLPARGLFAGEPADVGLVGSLASNTGASLVGRADLVLAFGAGLNDFTTMKRTFFSPSARLVRVDPEVTGERPNRMAVGREVAADALLTAEALLAAVPGGATGYRTAETLAQIAAYDVDAEFSDAADDEGLDPRSLMRSLDAALPPSRTIVTDVGHFFGFPASYLSSAPADLFVPAVEFGAVGNGLGVAIGASIAEPDRLTVAFVGDGGLMMSLGDLDTVRRESRRLLVVVMNDASYGSELHMLRAWGLDVSASVFPAVGLAAVAEALGVASIAIESLDEVGPAVARMTDDGPLLLDCRITTHVVADWLAGAFDH